MSNLHIKTTQNINLFFTTASIGERMFAYAVDLLIQTAYFVVVFLILAKIFYFNIFEQSQETIRTSLLLISLPAMFYSLILEYTLGGQTLGKMLLRIKVVKIDGYQAGFFDYFVRWIFSIVDVHMAFVPGLVAMISTKHTRRLGDLAAGTAVISEKSKLNISSTILMDVAEEYNPHFSRNQIMLFSDDDIRIIKSNHEMKDNKQLALIRQKIATRICTVMNIRNEFTSDTLLIDTFLKDYNFHTSK